jgi:beta-lactamase superfamily II metal-dependent hydrolase
MLLMGDLEADGLQALVRSATSNGRDLSADVVCLPHHGRSLEATWRLLELAGPEWAVVSCDRQAGYYLDADEQARLATTSTRTNRRGWRRWASGCCGPTRTGRSRSPPMADGCA